MEFNIVRWCVLAVETISITELTQTIDKKFDRFKSFSSCGTGDYFQAAAMLNELRMSMSVETDNESQYAQLLLDIDVTIDKIFAKLKVP